MMRSIPFARRAAAGGVALLAIHTAGCMTEQTTEPGTATSTENLTGQVTFVSTSGTDCGPEQSFVLGAMGWGRSIANSAIFKSCVRSAMAGQIALPGDIHLFRVSPDHIGPYDVCNGDPRPASPINAVVDLTHSSQGVRISCSPNTNGGELAEAAVTTNPGPNETLTYLEPRLVASMNSSDPFLVAGVIWHEAMHQHGYVHGDPASCGYSPGQFPDATDSWMQRHSVPYIVGACMTYLGDISASCTTSCPSGKPVRNALDPSAACVCERDPRNLMSTNVAPAVATTPDGVMFFATDVDGRIYQNRVVLGQAAQGWLELDGGGATPSAPAAALTGNAPYVFVAVRGFDNNVYINQGGLGSAYVGWQTDHAIQTSVAPAVATTPDGVLFLATDTQGRIMANRVVLGQAGQGWREVGGGGRTDASPSAAVAGNNRNYMFEAVKGLDGYVYINQGSIGGGEVGWRSDFAFKTDVAPAVVTTPDGVIFFAKDLSGRILGNRVVLGQAGQGWREVGGGGRTSAAPAAAMTGNNNGYMFEAVKGLDTGFYINQGSIGGGEVGWFRD